MKIVTIFKKNSQYQNKNEYNQLDRIILCETIPIF